MSKLAHSNDETMAKSEEDALHRGPEYCHRAEGIVEALQLLALNSTPVDGWVSKKWEDLPSVEQWKVCNLLRQISLSATEQLKSAKMVYDGIHALAAAPTTAKDDGGA